MFLQNFGFIYYFIMNHICLVLHYINLFHYLIFSFFMDLFQTRRFAGNLI